MLKIIVRIIIIINSTQKITNSLMGFSDYLLHSWDLIIMPNIIALIISANQKISFRNRFKKIRSIMPME